MGNGSNSKDSYSQKIKVRKIKAVKKINDNMYSDVNEYWYNDITGVVYDLEKDYPIGKIEKDLDGNIIKLDNETYTISELIDIPEFKIFE